MNIINVKTFINKLNNQLDISQPFSSTDLNNVIGLGTSINNMVNYGFLKNVDSDRYIITNKSNVVLEIIEKEKTLDANQKFLKSINDQLKTLTEISLKDIDDYPKTERGSFEDLIKETKKCQEKLIKSISYHTLKIKNLNNKLKYIDIENTLRHVQNTLETQNIELR